MQHSKLIVFDRPVGRAPDSADVVAVYGVAALKIAIQIAGTLNGSVVRDTLVRFDDSLFICSKEASPYAILFSAADDAC